MAISIEEMMADLEAADAAGDTELANAIASRIKATRAAPAATPAPRQAPPPAPPAATGGPATQEVGTPIAGPVAAPSGPAGAAPQPAVMGGMTEQEYEAAETARLQQEMMNQQSFGQNMLQGVGQSFDSTGRGLRQLWNYATGDEEELAQLQRAEADARRLDAPLLGTGGGRLGQIAGHIAQAAVPVGAGAKAATTGGKIALNAGLGAGLGAIAPTVRGESRAKNAAISGAIGGALPAGNRLLGLVSDTKSAALRAAGRALGSGGATNAEVRALQAQGVRAAASERIAEITKRVQIPLAPIKGELQAIQNTYGKDLPRAVRNGIDNMIAAGNNNGVMKGSALAEARTGILREIGKAAESTKKGAGVMQTGLERLRRTLDNATDEALESVPRTVRDRLFGDPAKRLRAARAQYKSGIAPEVTAPYNRAAQRATVEALRRPAPTEN